MSAAGLKIVPKEETSPMGFRVSALLVLTLIAAPLAVRSEVASPNMIACHDEATKQYIADFRRIGLPQKDRGDGQVVVTSFVNDKSRYQIHYAECLARWNSGKAP
jgi:hypothetical protein